MRKRSNKLVKKSNFELRDKTTYEEKRNIECYPIATGYFLVQGLITNINSNQKVHINIAKAKRALFCSKSK